MDLNDIIGNRYGKLVVTSYSQQVKRHHKYFCKCDCGNTTEVFRDNLLNGHKISCANCWKIIKGTDFYRYICSDGQDFIFSKEDYNIVFRHRWFIDSNGYPKTNINNSTVLLSRLIMECPDNFLWIILTMTPKTTEDATFALQQFNRIVITKMSEKTINADIKVSACIAVANIVLTYL